MSLSDQLRNIAYRTFYGVTGPGRGISVILLYHSVGGASAFSMKVDVFKRQMRFLAEHFTIVPLRNFRQAMETGQGTRNLACLTFDDGYRDNHECALPILQELGLKATFFVTTALLGKELPTAAGPMPLMAPTQVRELAALGHEIGSHTVSHKKLTKVSWDVAKAEVVDSKHFLEDLLGDALVSFAYPKGDYNDSIKQLIGSIGFQLGATTRERLVADPDWLALPRVWISNKLGAKAFVAKLSPAVNWYARLRGR